MTASTPALRHQMDMDGGVNHHARFMVRRKRKADTQPENNERLSKRLSLLNLEQNGAMVYVHVENSPSTTDLKIKSGGPQPPRTRKHRSAPAASDDTMQVDDTKHKVYVYNLDDELSSESEPEDVDGKLVFLHDIEKHMRANRIPPHVFVDPRAVDEAAGRELVLYTEPRSLSVPQEQDSVRKAIIESRARTREAQRLGVGQGPGGEVPVTPASQTVVEDVHLVDSASVVMIPEDLSLQTPEDVADGDADAMELD